jgi:hypothetical protein
MKKSRADVVLGMTANIRVRRTRLLVGYFNVTIKTGKIT